MTQIDWLLWIIEKYFKTSRNKLQQITNFKFFPVIFINLTSSDYFKLRSNFANWSRVQVDKIFSFFQSRKLSKVNKVCCYADGVIIKSRVISGWEKIFAPNFLYHWILTLEGNWFEKHEKKLTNYQRTIKFYFVGLKAKAEVGGRNTKT